MIKQTQNLFFLTLIICVLLLHSDFDIIFCTDEIPVALDITTAHLMPEGTVLSVTPIDPVVYDPTSNTLPEATRVSPNVQNTTMRPLRGGDYEEYWTNTGEDCTATFIGCLCPCTRCLVY